MYFSVKDAGSTVVCHARKCLQEFVSCWCAEKVKNFSKYSYFFCAIFTAHY